MKTMKLIVLCLSLFLGCQFTYAQNKSQKQETYDQLVQQLKVIDNLIEQYVNQPNLSDDDKKNLEFHRKTRAACEKKIQKLFAEIVNEELRGIPSENEKQIYKLTEDLYARKISVDEYWRRIERLLFDISNRQSAYNYAYDFFENKSNEISNNTKGYDSKIANYDSEMTNIKERLYSKVYKKTKLMIEINNMQKDPNFSNEIDKIYYEETGRYLPESTREEIQDTYNAAANIYAKLASEKEKLESEKEKAEKEYERNQDVLKKLRELCPECK